MPEVPFLERHLLKFEGPLYPVMDRHLQLQNDMFAKVMCSEKKEERNNKSLNIFDK